MGKRGKQKKSRPAHDRLLINRHHITSVIVIKILMSSLLIRHEFTARACIPLRGAALEIAEHAEEIIRVPTKVKLILCVLSELCGEDIT
jgi:hypothetical protein